MRPLPPSLAIGLFFFAHSSVWGAGPVTVSAADGASPVAPGSIVAIYGTNLAAAASSATTLPLPDNLGGTSVTIQDASGVQAQLPLFFAGPTQINAAIPQTAVPGPATLTIQTASGSQTGSVTLAAVSPGLFAANQNGQGVAAAQLVTNTTSGQIVTDVFQCPSAANCMPVPLDLGAGNSALVLYGTGIRNRAALSDVTVTVAGQTLPAAFAGPAPGFIGLDQVNLLLPASLAGSGTVAVTVAVAGTASNAVTVNFASAATGQVTLKQLSSDTFTNSNSQHATEVEPHILSYGSTLVSAFQVGRVFSGASADIGFATSLDAGATWTSGYLPGITKVQNSSNPDSLASDPAVAYDARHGVWLVASLPVPVGGAYGVVVSRSTDGTHWQNPVGVPFNGVADKNWIVCDNGPASPYFGHCYVQWDDANNLTVYMSTSTDGGQTWGAGLTTADQAHGIGGQPLVQPNGSVVVPLSNDTESGILSFSSTDGGASWNSSVVVSDVMKHLDPGGIRGGPLPSAAVDMNGNIYVTWEDCRFRAACAANDIVMSISGDGQNWSGVSRVPIDSESSGVDHFIPGIGADPMTAGNSAHLGLAYYYYLNGNCSEATCQLCVGFVSSLDGGATWSAAQQLAGPMELIWLPQTSIGRMVGDYIATAFSNGYAFPVFAVAAAPSGSTFAEAIYTTNPGLSLSE